MTSLTLNNRPQIPRFVERLHGDIATCYTITAKMRPEHDVMVHLSLPV